MIWPDPTFVLAKMRKKKGLRVLTFADEIKTSKVPYYLEEQKQPFCPHPQTAELLA
jgi:hypothetical protein